MINVFQLSWYAMEKRLATTRPDDIEIMARIVLLVLVLLWKERDRSGPPSVKSACTQMVEGHSITGNNW